jgi:hypothetical protein
MSRVPQSSSSRSSGSVPRRSPSGRAEPGPAAAGPTARRRVRGPGRDPREADAVAHDAHAMAGPDQGRRHLLGRGQSPHPTGRPQVALVEVEGDRGRGREDRWRLRAGRRRSAPAHTASSWKPLIGWPLIVTSRSEGRRRATRSRGPSTTSSTWTRRRSVFSVSPRSRGGSGSAACAAVPRTARTARARTRRGARIVPLLCGRSYGRSLRRNPVIDRECCLAAAGRRPESLPFSEPAGPSSSPSSDDR